MMMTVVHGRLGRGPLSGPGSLSLSLSLSRLQTEDTNVISVGGAHGALLGHQNIFLVNKTWNQNAPKQ